MKPKQMILFAVAIGCGLVAMIGAQQILSGNKPPDEEMVKILVAKTDIDPGITLDKTNVEFKEWPKARSPEGALTKEEEFAEHALKLRISAGMPVLAPYLGSKGQVGIASQIPKGMIVVTVPVDSTMTHSGLMRAGSSVTVTCAVSRPPRDASQRENILIKTVLKRVKVIAVGNQVAGTDVAAKEPNAAKVENVSFVVFPRQANLLNLAKEISKGHMQLALLGEEDKSTEDSQDMDETALNAAKNDLLGDKAVELLDSVPKSAGVFEKPRQTGTSFSEYLKQQPVATEVLDLGNRPSKPVWRITIWNGDTRDIQEVEMADEPVAAPVSTPPVSHQWTAPFKDFFSRKRSVKSSMQESQTTPTDESRPDSSSDKSAATTQGATRQ